MNCKDAKIAALRYLEDKLMDTLHYVSGAKEFASFETTVSDIEDIISRVKSEMQNMTVGAHIILTHGSLEVYEEWEEGKLEEETKSKEELIAYQKTMQIAVKEVNRCFGVEE
jgi:hypothetical protein